MLFKSYKPKSCVPRNLLSLDSETTLNSCEELSIASSFKMLTCSLCSKPFVNRAQLESHTKSHTKEKPYKCLVCSAAFGHASSLKSHENCAHGGLKRIRKKNSHCPLCSYKCETNMKLRMHLRKHSNQLSFSCSVPTCGFKTKYERSVELHVRNVHSDERPYECQSDGCTYKSKTRKDLERHTSLHSNEKPFTCKVQGCDYACKRKSYLKGHIIRAHTDEKPFQCSMCDFQAKTRPEIFNHEFKHTKIKRFQCPVANCSYASSMKSKVKLHFDNKHRKKHLLCTEPKCNFRCSSIVLLKDHLKRHGNPMLKCPGDSCRYSTTSKTSLVKHISRFHKDVHSVTVMGPRLSDLQKLHCGFPNCDFQTKFPHHLDRHRKTHNEEERRNHVCSFCFSRFRYLSRLKSHVQRHVREKPYTCSLCKYTAGDGFNLVHHAKRTHHIYVTPQGKEDEVKKCHTCSRACLSYSEFVLHLMSHLKPVVVLERLHVHYM